MNIRTAGSWCGCRRLSLTGSQGQLDFFPHEVWNIDCVYTLCNNPAIDAMVNKAVFQLNCLHELPALFHSYSHLHATEQSRLDDWWGSIHIMLQHERFPSVPSHLNILSCLCLSGLTLWLHWSRFCKYNLYSKMVEHVFDTWSDLFQKKPPCEFLTTSSTVE